jgi:hypothetical protein
MKKRGIVIGGLLLLAACQQPESSKPKIINVDRVALVAVNRELNVFAGIDKTGSATDNRIPQMSIAQLKSLLALIARSGGEFRLATICDRSDRSMARIQFQSPPVAPVKPTALPQTGTVNSFKMAELRRQYQKDLSRYQTELVARDRAVQEHNTENEGKITTFIQQIKPILDQTASCGSTDIVGVLQRGDLFLQEPETNGAKKVALLITDGIHNTSGVPGKLPWHNSAEVLTVSGGQGVGILNDLKPKSFESIDAAIRYLEGIK